MISIFFPGDPQSEENYADTPAKSASTNLFLYHVSHI